MTSLPSANDIDVYSFVINNATSIELRVDNDKVKDTVAIMEGLGFKGKNSWASMQLKGYTVIEFWKKDLVKSEAQENGV
ncbi:hypothetical protein [Paenibacillus aestuarii]|uniref:Uncharacterized protein n=1 Tax=Paenibacillus aestuarii TaxID=516965 RepID=A0ABW0KFK3_9BACL|nr:hypothetical protein [Paenibacillus aestuarii]